MGSEVQSPDSKPRPSSTDPPSLSLADWDIFCNSSYNTGTKEKITQLQPAFPAVVSIQCPGQGLVITQNERGLALSFLQLLPPRGLSLLQPHYSGLWATWGRMGLSTRSAGHLQPAALTSQQQLGPLGQPAPVLAPPRAPLGTGKGGWREVIPLGLSEGSILENRKD